MMDWLNTVITAICLSCTTVAAAHPSVHKHDEQECFASVRQLHHAHKEFKYPPWKRRHTENGTCYQLRLPMASPRKHHDQPVVADTTIHQESGTVGKRTPIGLTNGSASSKTEVSPEPAKKWAGKAKPIEYPNLSHLDEVIPFMHDKGAKDKQYMWDWRVP